MKKGFTLIELLVVVLIIGILSAVALPKYQKAVERAKGVEAMTVGKSIADAENIYYLENGEYDPLIDGHIFSRLSIDIPELKNWDIGTGGISCNCGVSSGACSGSVCRFRLDGDVREYEYDAGTSGIQIRTEAQVSLVYNLKEGKTLCRCCNGPKCQSYFGVGSGEQF